MRVLALVLASVVLGFGMKGDGDGSGFMVRAGSNDIVRAGVLHSGVGLLPLDVLVLGRTAIQEGMDGGPPLSAPRAELGAGSETPEGGIDDGAAAARSGFSVTIRQLARTITETPEPTVEPEPVPTPHTEPLTVQELICTYNWSCSTALAVAWCESGYRSVQNYSGYPYFGIYQLWSGHFRPGERWDDPAMNIAVAYRLWQGQGWAPWESSRSCWG